ncbi:hypothetical protein D9757_010010 [Collybiopsis confluens]|uniref:Uncharacterized protein n=1 Tax=Collybiopsis confluens TaxID=2823264 RepID=A0A8H5GV05_9AGAR|nr:hypothetical protein D9757_010010 [Collybiopsis confluens]
MMKLLFLSVFASVSSLVAAQHAFTLVNRCGSAVNPVFANTACGYSPRCAGAGFYTAAQPGSLAPGASKTVSVPVDWVGRLFNQNGACGASGEDCTITEYNLDTGDTFTPQAYDISNIQGFTQSIQLGAAGCDTVTCTNANCGCSEAYPIGDTSGCGNDSPTRWEPVSKTGDGRRSGDDVAAIVVLLQKACVELFIDPIAAVEVDHHDIILASWASTGGAILNNLVLTTLIVYRVRKLTKVANKYLSDSEQVRSGRLVKVIVGSYLLYGIGMVALLGYVMPKPTIDPLKLTPILALIVGISPTFLVVELDLGSNGHAIYNSQNSSSGDII